MNNIKHIRDCLEEHPFFSDLAPHYLDLIAGCGELARFETGNLLMKEGDTAGSFFLLRKGRVAIETHCPRRGALTISVADAGDVVGYSWLFPPYRTVFDARALSPVGAIALNGACLRTKAEHDHELGYQLMTRFSRILLDRLNATRCQLLDIYGHGHD